MAQYLLTVDYPPSTNTYYTVSRGRKILSTKGRNYKETIAKQIVQQLGKNLKPLTGRLRIYLGFSRYDRRDYDIGNYEKCLTDCFTSVLYTDDSQFDEIILKRLPISSNGYTEVMIEQIPKSKKK